MLKSKLVIKKYALMYLQGVQLFALQEAGLFELNTLDQEGIQLEPVE